MRFTEIREEADKRKQNALWAQITAHEKAAKKSKDLKRDHHLKMADQLRGQLKTSDNVAEGTGNIGKAIKAAYKKIYDQGDDAVEFAYYDSPIFAQYWDEYEGDLDSIIAEVEPSELQVILDELQSAAEDQGVAEGNFTKTPSGDYVNMHTGVRSSAAPAQKKVRGYKWEVHFDYGPHMSDSVVVTATSENEARAKAEKAAQKAGRSIMINWAKPAEQGVAETRAGNRMSDMSVGSPKIVYKNGRAVGEIGLDHDPSPGQGPYYMKHYETNTWYSGYDTKKEALDDLKHVVDQMNEGVGSDVAKLGGIAALGIAGGLAGNYADQQQPKVEVGGKIAFVEPAHSRVPDSAMILTGKDGKTYRVWATRGTAQSPHRYHAVPVEGVKEGGQKPGEDYIDPPEADYGDDYQAMVSRVKKLAGLGPLKTVYDPTKRVYKNVPTAVQPGDKK